MLFDLTVSNRGCYETNGKIFVLVLLIGNAIEILLHALKYKGI